MDFIYSPPAQQRAQELPPVLVAQSNQAMRAIPKTKS
jgi:hypothetical protein